MISAPGGFDVTLTVDFVHSGGGFTSALPVPLPVAVCCVVELPLPAPLPFVCGTVFALPVPEPVFVTCCVVELPLPTPFCCVVELLPVDDPLVAAPPPPS